MFNIKMINRLVIITLILINILILSKFQLIFDVISSITSTLFMPFIVSIMLYYLIRPVFRYLLNLGLDKLSSIIVIYVTIILSISLISHLTIPSIKSQLEDLITNLPSIIKHLSDEFNRLLLSVNFLSKSNIEQINSLLKNQLLSMSKSLSIESLSIVNKMTSSLINVLFSIFISPFVIFYLLTNDINVNQFSQKFISEKYRKELSQLINDVDCVISSYVQGQLTISFFVFIIFLIVFNIIGLPYATLFSVMGGLLNMIPYFGSLLLTFIVLVFSITISPIMLIKTIIACIVEQTIEGRIITPVILGKQLDINPLTIIVVLLTANSLFGVFGVFLAIPIYSILKIVTLKIIQFYRI